MKVIVKKGAEHLFLEGCHFDKDVHKDTLIVNLNKRWVYRDSTFKDDILQITLNTVFECNAQIDIIELAFSSKVKDVVFNYEEKDQLLFNIK